MRCDCSTPKRVVFGLIVCAGVLAIAGVNARGDFFVASDLTDEVLRFSDNGGPRGAFVTAGSGGLNSPRALAWGPDGNLYVGGATFVNVYDSTNGAFMGTVHRTTNQLFGIAFAPSGELLVSVGNVVQRVNLGERSVTASIPVGYTAGKLLLTLEGNVLVGNGSGGAGGSVVKEIDLSTNEVSVFASGGGLNGAFGLDYGLDGNVYTCNLYGDYGIYKIDAATGALLGKFTDSGVVAPADLIFIAGNRLWVGSVLNSGLNRFDATTGELISSTSGGSNNFDLLYVPEPAAGALLCALAPCLLARRRERNIGDREKMPCEPLPSS
jgi:hypothetical protein